jgi:hypothetical protein
MAYPTSNPVLANVQITGRSLAGASEERVGVSGGPEPEDDAVRDLWAIVEAEE